MAWIESHQALGQHPKMLQFARLLKVTLPTAVGHLHYFWWWALDFAPTGAIPNPTPGVVAHAAQWSGNPDRFWLALIQAGFLEVNEDQVCIHDWLDYAGRIVARREASRERSRKWRTRTERVTNANERAPNAPSRARETNQPTGDSVAVSLNQPTQTLVTTADAQGADAHASARKPPPEPPEPAIIHASAGVCPLCRVPYLGSYLEHTAEKHRVHPEPQPPGNLGPSLRHKRTPSTTAPPPEVEAQFAAMHERLQSMPGAS